MTAWGGLRPGQFDRTQLGKRAPADGLFAKSAAQQLRGQAEMFGDGTGPDTGADPLALFTESECGESQ